MRNFGQWITATPPEMEWIVNPEVSGTFKQAPTHWNLPSAIQRLLLAIQLLLAILGHSKISWCRCQMIRKPTHLQGGIVQHHRKTPFGRRSWTGFLFGKWIWRRIQVHICGPDPPKIMMNLIIFEQTLGLLVEVPLLVRWIQQQKY